MAFLVIEQREPHAGRMAFAAVEQPGTFEARHALALRIRAELEVPLPILIDGMDDASRALFGDLPSPAFVIGRDGSIVDKLPWADPEAIGKSLAQAAAGSDLAMEPAGPWTLDQRDVMARRLVWMGKHAQARAWLDTASEPAPSVPPTFVACARAAITRAHATGGADEAVLLAAQAAVAQAWPKDPARRVAALTELAELARDLTHARGLWTAAAAAVEDRAPVVVREFLAQELRVK